MKNAAHSAIVVYHSLDNSGDLFSTGPAMFRAHLNALVESGIQIVPLEAIQTTPQAIALTFDDGYANFREHALPYLLELELPATVFVVSGQCGRTSQWESRMGPHVNQKLLNWSELREIASAGIGIGAHTVSHENLALLTDEKVIREMRDSRAEIESRIGLPVKAFAYPYGVSNRSIQRVARQQFQIACGTHLSLVHEKSNPFDLPRIFDFYLRHRYLNRPVRLRRLNQMEGRVYLAMRRWLSKARDHFR